MSGGGGQSALLAWPLCVLVSVFPFGVSSGLCPHLVCHVSLRVSHLCLRLLSGVQSTSRGHHGKLCPHGILLTCHTHWNVSRPIPITS